MWRPAQHRGVRLAPRHAPADGSMAPDDSPVPSRLRSSETPYARRIARPLPYARRIAQTLVMRGAWFGPCPDARRIARPHSLCAAHNSAPLRRTAEERRPTLRVGSDEGRRLDSESQATT